MKLKELSFKSFHLNFRTAWIVIQIKGVWGSITLNENTIMTWWFKQISLLTEIFHRSVVYTYHTNKPFVNTTRCCVYHPLCLIVFMKNLMWNVHQSILIVWFIVAKRLYDCFHVYSSLNSTLLQFKLSAATLITLC